MTSIDPHSIRRIGFVELPDEALDLFGHYAQRPDWEVVVVVSIDPQSYASRMAEVLKIPLLDQPNRPALVACERLVVGKKAGLLTLITELVGNTDIEVVPLDDALAELAVLQKKQAARPRKPAEAPPAAAPDEAPPAPTPRAPGAPAKPHAHNPAATPPRPAATPPKTPPRTAPPKEPPRVRSFDAGTLLGHDLREKLGALSIDSDGDRVLQEILQMAVRVTHADSGSIMLVDDSGKHLQIAVANGLPQWVIDETRQKVGSGIAGTVFATGKPRLVQGTLPNSESMANEVRPGLRSAACVPIPTRHGPIGVLNVSVASESQRLDRGTIVLLKMFAREASGAVIKALNLKRLSGTARREATLRQIERLMSLAETLPARFRSVAEVLGQNLGSHFAHTLIADSEGKQLVLFGPTQGTAALHARPIPLDRGFLGWTLKRGEVQILGTEPAGDEQVAMAYLPLKHRRPFALLVFEQVPVRDTTTEELRFFLQEIQEILEAYLSLEQEPGERKAS